MNNVYEEIKYQLTDPCRINKNKESLKNFGKAMAITVGMPLLGATLLYGLTHEIQKTSMSKNRTQSVETKLVNNDELSDIIVRDALGRETVFLQQKDGSYISFQDQYQAMEDSLKAEYGIN